MSSRFDLNSISVWPSVWPSKSWTRLFNDLLNGLGLKTIHATCGHVTFERTCTINEFFYVKNLWTIFATALVKILTYTIE